MDIKLNNLSDSSLSKVMQIMKGKKLTNEQKIKFRNFYKKNKDEKK